MEKMGATISLVLALFLLAGMLLQPDTRVLAALGIAGLAVLVGVYEVVRKAQRGR